MYPLLRNDPRKVGRYTVHARLGAGGMGVVYYATDPDGVAAAVKIIRDDLLFDARFLRQFGREIEILRRVSTTYATTVLDADLDDEGPWFATAYVPGVTLAERVHDGGALCEPEALRLASGLAQALCALHGGGVVHRDIKPANVVLGGAGPVLIDFGIAAVNAADCFTDLAVRIGSPAWMAPEEVTGEREAGTACDVWAWGLTVAFATTGTSPFGQGAVEALLYRVVHQRPDLSGVPHSLLPALTAALSRDPDNRPSAPALLRMLSEGSGPAEVRLAA